MRKQDGGGVLGSQVTLGEVDGVRQVTNGNFVGGGNEKDKGTSSPKRKRHGKTKHNMVLPMKSID